MKKIYFAPEVLVHKLEVKDIMTVSPDLNNVSGNGQQMSINDDVESEESDDDDW